MRLMSLESGDLVGPLLILPYPQGGLSSSITNSGKDYTKKYLELLC